VLDDQLIEMVMPLSYYSKHENQLSQLLQMLIVVRPKKNPPKSAGQNHYQGGITHDNPLPESRCTSVKTAEQERKK